MAAFSLQCIDQPLLPCFGTFDASTINYESLEKAGFSNNEPFLSSKCGDDYSIFIVESYNKIEFGEQITQKKEEKMEKKKSNGDGSSLISSSQSMDGIKVKRKRPKNCARERNEVKEKKLKKTHDKKAEKKISEEAPTEHVHVRARRGQATDSHSLAERVRREKIRDKMKILQGLVPGCDKVTGKSLMLDEIINYVLSLQKQVEFLSTKSACLDPMFFEFGMESNNVILTREAERLNADPPIISDTFTGFTSPTDIYPLHATSSLLFDPQIQRPYNLTEDDGQALWDVILDDQGQKFNNEFDFMTNNLCSFY